MPISLIMKIQYGGGRHIGFRKASASISGLNEDISTKSDGRMHHGQTDMIADRRYFDIIINNCKMAFSLHVLDRLSDDYNFQFNMFSQLHSKSKR